MACGEVLDPVRLVGAAASAADIRARVDDVQAQYLLLELGVDVEADGAQVVAETQGFLRAGLLGHRVEGLGHKAGDCGSETVGGVGLEPYEGSKLRVDVCGGLWGLVVFVLVCGRGQGGNEGGDGLCSLLSSASFCECFCSLLFQRLSLHYAVELVFVKAQALNTEREVGESWTVTRASPCWEVVGIEVEIHSFKRASEGKAICLSLFG